MIKLKEISELPSGTLKSTVNKEFDMVNKDMESYSCDLFSFDIYGGDRYYPMGRYEVNESLFIKSEE